MSDIVERIEAWLKVPDNEPAADNVEDLLREERQEIIRLRALCNDKHDSMLMFEKERDSERRKVGELERCLDEQCQNAAEAALRMHEAERKAERLLQALKGYVLAMSSGDPDLVEHADKQARAALAEAGPDFNHERNEHPDVTAERFDSKAGAVTSAMASVVATTCPKLGYVCTWPECGCGVVRKPIDRSIEK